MAVRRALAAVARRLFVEGVAKQDAARLHDARVRLDAAVQMGALLGVVRQVLDEVAARRVVVQGELAALRRALGLVRVAQEVSLVAQGHEGAAVLVAAGEDRQAALS